MKQLLCLNLSGILIYVPILIKVFMNASIIDGENIIATTKIINNYGAIQSLIFPILR